MDILFCLIFSKKRDIIKNMKILTFIKYFKNYDFVFNINDDFLKEVNTYLIIITKGKTPAKKQVPVGQTFCKMKLK